MQYMKKVVKKAVCDKLVKNYKAIKTIDTSNLVKKTDYNTKINELEKKTIDHDHSNEQFSAQNLIG